MNCAARRPVHIHDHQHQLAPATWTYPMAQGLIDFARFGQLIHRDTPFTLMGAMAPITVAGAHDAQSHAECAGGDHADATCRIPGRRSDLRHVHVQCRHEVRRARVRNARAQVKASPGRRAAGPQDRPALALRGRALRQTSTTPRPRTRTQISGSGAVGPGRCNDHDPLAPAGSKAG